MLSSVRQLSVDTTGRACNLGRIRAREKAVGLAEQFIAQTGGGAIEATADLEQALRDLLDQARSAWPMVGLPDAIFLRYLAERVGEGGDLATILRTLHAADLYLAC